MSLHAAGEDWIEKFTNAGKVAVGHKDDAVAQEWLPVSIVLQRATADAETLVRWVDEEKRQAAT